MKKILALALALVLALALAPAAGRAEIKNMIYHRMSNGLAELDSYSPAEVEMPAWPWLEAGDALEITASDLPARTSELEKRMILKALEENHDNKSKAIRQLKISRKKFYAKLKEFGLE